jgi:hypothetical protein
MKFPMRFELENLDPLQVRVLIVDSSFKEHMFDNLASVPADMLKGLLGPMADKRDGQWVVRFEAYNVYEALSK